MSVEHHPERARRDRGGRDTQKQQTGPRLPARVRVRLFKMRRRRRRWCEGGERNERKDDRLFTTPTMVTATSVAPYPGAVALRWMGPSGRRNGEPRGGASIQDVSCVMRRERGPNPSSATGFPTAWRHPIRASSGPRTTDRPPAGHRRGVPPSPAALRTRTGSRSWSEGKAAAAAVAPVSFPTSRTASAEPRPWSRRGRTRAVTASPASRSCPGPAPGSASACRPGTASSRGGTPSGGRRWR